MTMDRNKCGAEIARVSNKVKNPFWRKTVLALMSDGSMWERITTKKRSKKIKSSWTKVGKLSCSSYARVMFLRIFTGSGWKQKGI